MFNIKIDKRSFKRHRITWGFNPVTRVVPNKKIYNRKKFKKEKAWMLKY